MESYSTHEIRKPGERPIRVDFNETGRGTFVASVKDALEGFPIRAFSTVEITRAEFDALPWDRHYPAVFSDAAIALFYKRPEPLDHGVLSVPNRTKNINRDLDKYKAEKAKQDKREREDARFSAKERAAARRTTEGQALDLYKKHGTKLRAAVKGKLQGTGQTPGEWLKNEAKASPQWFINFVNSIIKGSKSL